MTQSQEYKRRILWIDDTFVNELHELMAYEDELKYSGEIDIVKIAHVDKALDILEKREETFACIIIDIMMPYGKFTAKETEAGNKTGIVLARKIHQIDKHKGVPIVLLTGVRLSLETLAQCKQEDLPCFFKADVKPDDFLNEIKIFMGGRHE